MNLYSAHVGWKPCETEASERAAFRESPDDASQDKFKSNSLLQ